MNDSIKIPLADGRTLDLSRPRIMGILNVTPDSFSDGGKHNVTEGAIAHALAMITQGADVIDVGGESTRPGSTPVEPKEQIARVVPTIQGLVALRRKGEIPAEIVVSIDTSRPEVATEAINVGADVINDIHAGRDTPGPDGVGMLELAARRGTPIVLMHMQGTPATMQNKPTYTDVVHEVRAFLLERAGAAMTVGIEKSKIILDPGIGFGKTREHNLTLLANLKAFTELGYPVLLGSSRKRFMGALCTERDGRVPTPEELVGATCATTSVGVLAGVHLFRVHDVRANKQAADVAVAMKGR